MSIPFNDRGLTLGDGLFETVLADGGELVAFDRHAERMERSCAVLDLPAPDRAHLRRCAEGALVDAGLGGVRAAVRITWTAGSGGRGLERPAELQPRLFATAVAALKPTAPARLVTARVRRNESSPTSRLKTLSYLDNILARHEALDAGADEALMLNTRGELAGGAAANIFWLKDDRLFTPALDCGVLAGIARAEVIEAASQAGFAVEEVRVGPEALARAQGVFLTNSLIGLRPVAAIDGAPQQPVQVTAVLMRGRR
jgi:branched-subunit amino acid aminotransferase/4-amino-4-deoxychorismate lyase